MKRKTLKRIIKHFQNIKILLLITLICLLTIPMLFSISYATDEISRETMQDMVVSTALSYYYNNIYTDYNQYSKDEKITINGTLIRGSYLWVNLNQSPEEISRTNKFSTACSAFSSTIYRYALGYDFSDYYSSSAYNYFKNGKYYPYVGKDYTPESLYHDTEMTQELFQEMAKTTGGTVTTYHFEQMAKSALKKDEYKNTIGSYTNTNADNESSLEVYYHEVTGETTEKLSAAVKAVDRTKVISEIKSLLQLGDLIVYRRQTKDSTGELTGDSTGHVVIYVGDIFNENEFGVIHSTGYDYDYNEDGTMNYPGDDRYSVRYDLVDTILNNNILVETNTKITNRVAILRPINKFCEDKETCSFPTGNSEFAKAYNSTDAKNSLARTELSRLKMEQYVSLNKTPTNDTTINNSISKYNSVNVGDIINYNLEIQNKANISYCSDGKYYLKNSTKYPDNSCEYDDPNDPTRKKTWITSERAGTEEGQFSYSNLTITSKIPDNTEYVEGSCKVIYSGVAEEYKDHSCEGYNEETRTITWKTKEIKPNNKISETGYDLSSYYPKYTYTYQVKVIKEGTITNEGMEIITPNNNTLKFGELETTVNPTLNELNISKIKSLVNQTIEKQDLLTYNGMTVTNNYTTDINTLSSNVKLAEGEYLKMLYYNALGIDIGYLNTSMVNALFNTITYDIEGTEIDFYTKKLNSEVESLTGNQEKINKMLVPGLYGGRLLKGNDNGDREVIMRIKSYDYVENQGANDFEFGDIIYTYNDGTLNSFMYYGQNESGFVNLVQFTESGIQTYDKNTTPSSFRKVMSIYASDLFWVIRPTRLYGTTVNYNYNDGNELESSFVAYNTYKNLNNPTKESFTLTLNYNQETITNTNIVGSNTFDGWYDESYTTKVTNDSELLTTDNHTLYAKWTPETITLPQPTKEGYILEGWYSDENLTTKVASNGGTYTINSTTTLHAKWTPITYKIQYNANGGTGTMTTSNHTYDIETTLTKNTYIKEEYLFYGWSTSETGQKIYNDQAKVINLTSTNNETINLYAVWGPDIEIASNGKYIIEDNYIKNIKLKTNITDLDLTLPNNFYYKIYNYQDIEKTSGFIATSDKLKIYSSDDTLVSEYIIIIKGDVTGTGLSNVSDVAKLYQYLKGKITMDYCFIEAGNVTGSTVEIKINDVAKLYQYIKGKVDSLED